MIDPEEIAKWESEAADPHLRAADSRSLFLLVRRAADIIKALGDALDQESAREVRDESMITALRDKVHELQLELKDASRPRCRNCGRVGHDECGRA